jgi:hypothetical protein
LIENWYWLLKFSKGQKPKAILSYQFEYFLRFAKTTQWLTITIDNAVGKGPLGISFIE